MITRDEVDSMFSLFILHFIHRQGNLALALPLIRLFTYPSAVRDPAVASPATCIWS